jgi:CRP/FNR family transcriptional regulator, cyclic AMP receptor protein
MHQTIHALVSESAIVRLASLLQRHANESGPVRVAQGDRLNLKLSHYQIARSIGISYEECVRLLGQIKAVVSYQRGGKIIVLDRETLDAIVDGTIDLKTLVKEREARS